MRYGADYDLMLKAQKSLMILMDKPMKPAEASKLTQALVLVVSYKRELRGLPRLKASDLLATMKRLPNAQRSASTTPIELSDEPEPSKESLKHSFSETVPTPPPSDAPERGQ